MMVKRLIFVLGILSASVLSAQIALEDLDIIDQNSMIEYNGDLWIFGPGYSSSNNPTTYNALKSTDGGENWTIEIPNDGTLHHHSVTVDLNGTLISVGGHPSSITNDVKISTDGINWTTHTGPFTPRTQHAVVVHNNKVIMVAGYTSGHNANNDAWSTTNGIDWVRVSSEVSTVFPHFYSPKLVSVNNKLILFGGVGDGIGYPKNERGVYVSDDDGANWTRYEFPYETVLSSATQYFVYKNRLWVRTGIKRYGSTGEASTLRSTENRYFSTADGETWKMESGHIPLEYIGLIKIANFNDDVFIFERGNGPTTKTVFSPSEIEVTHNFGTLNKVTPNASVTIPFEINSPNATSGFKFCIKSSRPDIISIEDISWSNNELTFQPTEVIGESLVSIKVSDGVTSHTELMLFKNFPQADVEIAKIGNKLTPINGDTDGIRVFRNELENYGTNTYSFQSSDHAVIDPANISVLNLGAFNFLNLTGYDLSSENETEISVTATDGNTSFTQSFWVKVGTDEAPVLNGTLDDITIAAGESIDFTMPAGTFTDPEAEPLYYSADNLPCGFNLDPATGNISGSSTDDLPYNIIIIAKDKYGQTAEVPLNILDATTNIEDDFENESHVSLYPNPVSDVFTIESTENIEYIRIYNMVGSMVYQQEIDATSAYINPELLSGNYIVEIHTQTDNRMIKMIVR